MNAVILKIGGSILAKLPDSFYEMVVQLKKSGICEPVIVHGGGPDINQALEKFEVESTFIDGLRVTTDEVLDIAEMVMSGSVNKKIVHQLEKAGGAACGVSGLDCSLLKAAPVDPTGALGYVGQVAEVNSDWLNLLVKTGIIPVISPIGMDASGQRYNINGDMAASAVAGSLKGKLVLISDIPGVMESLDNTKIIHPVLTKQQVEEKISTGVIHGGMIPKVRSALKGLDGGATESVILNGLDPIDLKNYIEGKKAGTKVVMEKEAYHV
ncbi:acetylglutamate kinase [Virgibacillus indicus]|uniref:Acetylglutamate kinase n=1 Tax=Virgibacillus indicus TaxID=2024554 RepID=A0A265N7P2_9BACI|nr:acetylglutamate kinase [Virgibacillus indicus]OZU87847.1 acetylglutamate kinase [Virgibacillus indicus]